MAMFQVRYVRTPTNHNQRRVMLVEAPNAGVALQTWRHAMRLRGDEPSDFTGHDGGTSRPLRAEEYDVPQLGTVIGDAP